MWTRRGRRSMFEEPVTEPATKSTFKRTRQKECFQIRLGLIIKSEDCMTKSKMFATMVLTGVLAALSGCGDAGTQPKTSTSTGATVSTSTATSAATGSSTGTGASVPAPAGKVIAGWRGNGTGNFPNAKP